MKSKFFFTAALAAMALTSCQKDDAEQGSVQPGQDTYIGMTIQLPKSVVSRAFQGDDNATEAESKLTSVTVGVWSDGDNAVTYTTLDIATLTNVGNGTYTATKAVKAKTGSNNIIVLANTTAEPSITQINGDAFDATVADIAKVDNFVMYSTAVTVMANVVFASKADVESATAGPALIASNKATVTLRRAAAKVAVTSTLVATGGSVVDVLGNGTLTNIVWNIANQNEQMTVFPKFVTGTNFIVSNVNSPFTRLAAVDPATALPLKDAPAAVDYCLENAHGASTSNYLENNTTAVQVRAIFAPAAQKYVSTITGTTANAVITPGADVMVAGTSFYVSKVDIATQVAGTFFAEAAVDGAVSIFGMNKTNDFTKYEGGKCFWAIWINDGEDKLSYGVLRNNMYTMNITGIKAPGLPAFPDSSNPIVADTWIMVDLNVEQWNVKGMGDIEL